MSPVVSARTQVDTSMHWSRFHYIREADLRQNAKAKLLKNVLFNSGPITRGQVINSFSCLIVYKLQLKYISTSYQSSLLCWQTTFAPIQLVHSMEFVSQAEIAREQNAIVISFVLRSIDQFAGQMEKHTAMNVK